MTITLETLQEEFFGFLHNFSEDAIEKVKNDLNSPSLRPIFAGESKAQTVETIAKRNPTYYYGIEASELAPITINNPENVCAAKFEYAPEDKFEEDKEREPWAILNRIQYEYGKYLKFLIDNEIIETATE